MISESVVKNRARLRFTPLVMFPERLGREVWFDDLDVGNISRAVGKKPPNRFEFLVELPPGVGSPKTSYERRNSYTQIGPLHRTIRDAEMWLRVRPEAVSKFFALLADWKAVAEWKSGDRKTPRPPLSDSPRVDIFSRSPAEVEPGAI